MVTGDRRHEDTKVLLLLLIIKIMVGSLCEVYLNLGVCLLRKAVVGGWLPKRLMN